MSCFNTAPLGVVTRVEFRDRIVEKIVEKKFDPSIGMKNPMVGSEGVPFTVVAVTPNGRVGIRNISDGSARIRVELADGGYVNRSLIPSFSVSGKNSPNGRTAFSAVAPCGGTCLDAVIAASKALSNL